MEATKVKSTGVLTFLKAKGRLWLLLGGALAGIQIGRASCRERVFYSV